MLRRTFFVEEKLIGQHFHRMRYDMILIFVHLLSSTFHDKLCTAICPASIRFADRRGSLQLRESEVLTRGRKGGLVAIGECGAARMARRKWLLEKKVRRHFHNPLDSPGLMSRRRDGYLKRRFVIISTIPMAIAKIGCGPSNFHLQTIL